MMRLYVFVLLGAAACFGLAALIFVPAPADAQTAASKSAATPTPTPAPPTIKEEDIVEKVDTELVNLNVRVVDRNNRPVNSLTQSDFKILEDNTPQEIGFFSKSEVPTNYSLVIDNSGSLRSQIDRVIEASKILVGTNRPGDETSVIRFISSEKIEVLQDFTADRSELDYALDSLYIEGGQTAIIDAVYLAVEKVSDYEKAQSPTDRKRRALILVSDGEDITSYYSQQQLFNMLRESDVQIYVVGFVNDLSTEKGFITKSKQGKAKSFLEKLATETGGKAYFPKNTGELNDIAKDIASELRTQYSIGYIPSNDRKDGTFRNIRVMISDGPNNEKRIALTKAGRTAEKDGTSPSLATPVKPTKAN